MFGEIKERKSFYTISDTNRIIETASFVYRLHKMLDTKAFRTAVYGDGDVQKTNDGILDPTRTYTIIGFVETILKKKMNQIL